MDPLNAVFNWPLPFFGFRIISAVSYLLWFSLAWFRLQPAGLPTRRRFATAFFFTAFMVMSFDWTWTFAQNTRWRPYIPPTGEHSWISLQPWPLGPEFRDIMRIPLYIATTLLAILNLLPLFKNRTLQLNSLVFLAYGAFAGYWLLLVWGYPNPLFGDIGLWSIWPRLAAETGQGEFWFTVLRADIISRFLLAGPCALAWWKK